MKKFSCTNILKHTGIQARALLFFPCVSMGFAQENLKVDGLVLTKFLS